MGFYLYYGEMNYPAAEHELAAVHARWPNNAEALEALALIERRLGKWQESAADFARLVLLDPLVPSHRTALAGDLMELREFGSAIRVLDDALKIWPDDGTILASKADVYQEIGQLDRAEMTLRNVHPAPDDGNLYWPIMQQFWLRRQYAKGAAYFRGLIALGEERENPEAETFVLRVALGELLRMSGDEKGARESYARAIAFMLAQLKKQPDNADLLIPLSVAYAGMGDTAMALRTSEESITLFRRMNDQLDATDAEDNHMDLMARFGDRGAAIREIEAQLKGPGLITPALLRLEPELDRLRGDPRFNNLLKTPTQR
jgi:tetratricopeptide (TPR) repeat protein